MAQFVVNLRGAVHSVDDKDVAALLKRGFRIATNEEICDWYEMQGLKLGEVSDGENEHGATDQSGKKSHRRSSRH